MASRTLLVFGLGFSARVLVDRLRPAGWSVRATARSADKVAALRAEGIDAFLFDGAAPIADISGALDGVSHLLLSVPPGADGDPVLNHHGGDIAARADDIAWAGYLSTTGVYGDRAGGWVDETSELIPATERGRRRVDAEAGWCRLWQESGLPIHLFRLAGIYGPGRSALETVRAGNARRVVKEGQVFSRTHVADIATVLEASITRPNPGAAYNVCDDDPAPPQEVVTHACELLGVALPPEIAFADAEMSEMGRSFYAESKRVSNRRIKEELGVALAYPDYRAGLAALLADT
ncbi:MAG: SDR family oxidoreductase [Rhodospirillaceae bacterium]|jgi:nucleoside-diphosphate-sugar epimerase|nr:SDR family oxidoreductase [Rhodospirillaceae bacterium]MBT3811090.1 SDR family oxidoreductase [Rhodospirillaceae bacterium]MBT3932101.1 SDR family oxidoreductase [Rhodospirillaceae bacterium]MBT4773195.1 SDR family oxidoreductase [Rhodospirillaceae bacterium]MBT5358376.1 SDR family oxidoreductase [Rhodospirillaceae bacterium]